jgi:hypothetical protein
MTKKVTHAECSACGNRFEKVASRQKHCSAQCFVKGNSIENANECWIWSLAPAANGYGIANFNAGRRGGMYAHRFSFIAFKGEIPAGLLLRHTCDVRNCVNPDHLVAGTWSDNARDMSEKGRQPRTRLSPADVIRMRQMYPEHTIREIAAAFRYSTTAVHRILHKKSWIYLE